MAKQRDFLILQSKCDFSTPFATHFFEIPKTLDTARVAGCCKRGMGALQPYPFFLQQNRTAKSYQFYFVRVSSQICHKTVFYSFIGNLLDFLSKRAYGAFLGVTNHYSLFSLPVTATGSFFLLFGAGVTLPLFISINSLTFCGTTFA